MSCCAIVLFIFNFFDERLVCYHATVRWICGFDCSAGWTMLGANLFFFL